MEAAGCDSGTRTMILAKALGLFAAKGFESVGIQTVCETCGVTKPTLYYWFGSKRGLFDSIVAVHGEAYIAVIRETASYEHDLVKTLEACAFRMIGYSRRNPDFFRLLLSSYFAPPESESHIAVKPVHDDLFAIFLSVFTQASSDHGNMKTREQLLAVSWLGTINYCVGLELSRLEPLRDEEIRRIVHTYMHGIFS